MRLHQSLCVCALVFKNACHDKDIAMRSAKLSVYFYDWGLDFKST